MWYGATKAAVDMITRHLATEFSPKGIRSNAVLPSISETPLMKEFMGQAPTAENKASLASDVPLSRLCTPLDIAKAVLYFASDYFNDYQT
jgi:3-oxoacyl-[acyl-carrier protein] reductase